MKKIFIITTILLCTLALVISSYAADASSASKDGLDASLTLSVDGDGDIVALVALTNNSCEYSDSFMVSVIPPEELECNPEKGMLTLGCGSSADLSFRLSRPTTMTEPTVIPDETTATDTTATAKNGGCGAGLAVPLIIVVILAGGLLYIGDRRRSTAFLLVMLICAGTVVTVIPTYAAKTERTIELSGSVSLEGEEVTVVAVIGYTYDFTETEVAKTEGMDKFEITYYWGPHGDAAYDEEFVRAIAECGFTSIPLENNSTENNKKALTVMKKYGLTCSALWDVRIYNLIVGDKNVPQETVDSVVREVVADYAEFDNIRGWWLKDEPAVADFEILAKLNSAFHRIDPDRVTSINLFPNYAKATQLGASTYKEYLEKFISQVEPDYISYDHYHFRNDGARAGFYSNLEDVRSYGLDSGLDQMLIVLLTKHMSYSNLTAAQIRWEVNMSMVYGMKRLSYFTFILDQNLINDGWTNGCMSYLGEKYPHYYDVQDINKWLKPLGDELFGKTSTEVFHLKTIKTQTLESGCRAYEGYGDLGEVDGKNVVIGFFDDGSFMIVNKRFVENGKVDTVRLIDVKTGLEFFDTEKGQWCEYTERDESGLYVLTFDAGDGILLRVK